MLVCEPTSEYTTAKNKLIEDTVKSNTEKLEVMGKILWTQACKIVLEDTLLEVNEVRLTTTQWSNNKREL